MPQPRVLLSVWQDSLRSIHLQSSPDAASFLLWVEIPESLAQPVHTHIHTHIYLRRREGERGREESCQTDNYLGSLVLIVKRRPHISHHNAYLDDKAHHSPALILQIREAVWMSLIDLSFFNAVNEKWIGMGQWQIWEIIKKERILKKVCVHFAIINM